MSIMRNTETDFDHNKAETLEEIEADIAGILKDFDDFDVEIDFDDGTWEPLDPDAVIADFEQEE